MDSMAARKTKSLPDGVSARSLGGLDIRDFEKTVSARCPGSSKFDFLAENLNVLKFLFNCTSASKVGEGQIACGRFSPSEYLFFCFTCSPVHS